jgi:hypothetical protein
MGSSQQTPAQTISQQKDPWEGAAQPLRGMYEYADYLRTQNQGYQPWAGSTLAAVNELTGQGLGSQAAIAHEGLGGSAGNIAAQQLASGIIGAQGITGGVQNALTGLQGVGQMQGALYNPTAQNLFLQNYGAAQEPANVYRQLYGEASNATNPYLQGAINQQVTRANAAASGAGRYGSGAHDAAIAQAAAPILAQDYAQRQQQRMQAGQGLLGSLAQQQAAAQGYTGAEQRLLAGTQALGQTYGAMGDIYRQGLEQAGKYAQQLPVLEEAQYSPAERYAQVGQFYQTRDQQALNDQIKKYNADQAYLWEQLAREAAILQGAGGLGGSTVTGVPVNQPSTLQKLFGGALAGAGVGSAILPGWGTAAGAVGGGLLGLL